MKSTALSVIFCLAVGLLSACSGGGAATQDGKVKKPFSAETVFTQEELRHILRLSPLPPIPDDPTNKVFQSAAAARFGQYLFFDQQLSGPGNISCATCHQPGQSWADGQSLGRGIDALQRHTMALWNVAFNRWFFWDGRADSLWSQALQPLEDQREHGGSRLQYAHYIFQQTDLKKAYENIFGPMPDLSDHNRFPPEGRPIPSNPEHPHHINWLKLATQDKALVNRIFSNLGKAIAAFQRNIISKQSPFDHFVTGLRDNDPVKLSALSASALNGLKLFVGKARCHLCHSGPNFSDSEFHRTGVPPLNPGMVDDPGRQEGIKLLVDNPFRGTGGYSDKPGGEAALKIDYLPSHFHAVDAFKTPSLRNVALTAPYMHQGQLPTLETVVRFYNTLQSAVNPEQMLTPLLLSGAEIKALIAFMNSLSSGPINPAMSGQPRSPLFPSAPENGSAGQVIHLD